MDNIYRIFENNDGILSEIAFVSGQIVKDYLESCNVHNEDERISYFAQKIKVEK